MPSEKEIPFQEEIIPRFRVVQEIHHCFSDSDEQKTQTDATINALELDKLLGKQLMINSLIAYARKPDMPPDTHIRFPRGFLFFGELVGYSQLIQPEEPINAVTANFANPDVID